MSLTEVLIVIAIFVAITGISLPLFLGYRVEQNLDASAKIVAATLRDAQSRSITGEAGVRWGVRFWNSASGADRAELFSVPDSFVVASSDVCGAPAAVTVAASVTVKEKIELSEPGVGCVRDVLFKKLAGTPVSAPSQNEVVAVVVGDPSKTRTVQVAPNGTITY